MKKGNTMSRLLSAIAVESNRALGEEVAKNQMDRISHVKAAYQSSKNTINRNIDAVDAVVTKEHQRINATWSAMETGVLLDQIV